MKMNLRVALLVLLILASPAFSYDYPLTPEAIREAYIVGTSADAATPRFLSEYRHTIPDLKVEAYTSIVWIETPFTLIAEHSHFQMNYSAQDAVKEFLHKPAMFHVYLDICYWPPKPDPIKVRVAQYDKAVLPDKDEREGYFPVQADPYTPVHSIGEHIHLQFKPGRISSEDLLVEIDTPAGQHAETKFDLRTLK